MEGVNLGQNVLRAHPFIVEEYNIDEWHLIILINMGLRIAFRMAIRDISTVHTIGNISRLKSNLGSIRALHGHGKRYFHI
jgi:hypothetical protein